MEILFRQAIKGDRMDRLICNVTRGRFPHCEIRFPDGRCLSAHYKDGVVFRPLDTSIGWISLLVPWTPTDAMVQFAESIEGLPYDELGAISSGFGRPYEKANAYFCSECVACVGRLAGNIWLPQVIPPSGNRWTLGLYESILCHYTTVTQCHLLPQKGNQCPI